MGFQDIDADTLHKWITEKENFVLIDVRSPAETNRGIIPNARVLPLNLLPAHHHEIPKDIPVVIYCQSGARSAQACMFLSQHGADNLYNLLGGIMSWAARRMPIDFPNT